MTEWRRVEDLTGFEVSSDGRVRSVTRTITLKDGRRRKFVGQERKTFLVKGYLHLSIKINGRCFNRYVHALVCQAFHGPRPSPLHEVRHLNGNPLDNRAENLVWGTKSENALDTVRHGNNPWANKTECPKGHKYSPENTLISKGGGRLCRQCSRDAGRRYYAANRVAISARGRRRREAIALAEGRTLRKRPCHALTEVAA